MILWSEKIDKTRLLGPGNRAVLWVHGCCFDCPGCIARNFRFGSYHLSAPAELAGWFLETGMNAITISGGEPMLQAGGLAEMVRLIRSKKDIGLIVYTGFREERLRELEKTEEGIRLLLRETDLLIDGPYLAEEDHNEPYRGSGNQRILALTERYLGEIDAYYFGTRGRSVEYRISGTKTMMIGVPGKEQVEIWKKVTAHSVNGNDGVLQ